MTEIINLANKCEYLDLGGDGPRALVSLLGERPAWREDKLETAYYKATSPTFRTGKSNFRYLILELLEYGLIKEVKGKTGYRFLLNKTVWGQDVDLFQALNVLVHFYHENNENKLRSNVNLNTFLKRVVGRLSETKYRDINWSVTYPIAGFLVSKLRDFSEDTSIKKFGFAKRTPEQIKAASIPIKKKGRTVQKDLFIKSKKTPTKKAMPVRSEPPKPSTPPVQKQNETTLIRPQVGPKTDTPMGLPAGILTILNPEEFWPPIEKAMQADMLRPTIFADRNAMIIDTHITASRTQRTIIGVVKKLVKEYLIVFSLSGAVDKEIDLETVFGSTDLDPSGVHPRLLNIDGEVMVGVVGYLPLQSDVTFYETVSAVGKLADQLEAEFWQVDVF